MPAPPVQRKLAIAGPAGQLETLVDAPKERVPEGCAVVCHPHPLHGGTMQNKVAHTLARSFVGLDFVAVRFNFRGVGASDGKFDDGNGELSDALAVCEWASREFPGLPLWLSGFSFGAAMAISAATRANAVGLVSVAPAVSRFPGKLETQPQCPWLIVQGDKDELVAIDDTIRWVNELEPGPKLDVFPGAEHFFHGRLTDLKESVQAFVRENHPTVKDP